MVNIEQNIQNDPAVKDVKVLSRHQDGMPSTIYYKMKMSMMSDRDSVVSFEKFDLDDGRSVFITKSIDHPDYPVGGKVIRLEMYSASHIYQEGNDVRMLDFSYFDMKGWFPMKLMNMMIGAMYAQQLKDMAKKVR